MDSRTWPQAHIAIQFRRSCDVVPEVEPVNVHVLFWAGRDMQDPFQSIFYP